MTQPKFRLPPEVFDALHLSALANGGIGHGVWYDNFTGAPVCPIGLLGWADGIETPREWVANEAYGLNVTAVDMAMVDAGDRVSFERFCELVGVDVAEATHG
jgi:hypothetical protein